MDEITGVSSSDSRTGATALETLLSESLRWAHQATGARTTPSVGFDLPNVEGFERGDVRSEATTVDDGGSMLSTAPSANDLNGRNPQAWNAQAAEWLSRADSRQLNTPLAQQMALRSNETLALQNDTQTPTVASAAPTADAPQAMAAPFTAGAVREGQVGGTLDTDRLNNTAPRRPAPAG
jgi:hypothetical protein